MTQRLTLKEDEVLCLLRLGPLTMAELRGMVAMSEAMIMGILKHLKELGKVTVSYQRKPGMPSKYRGTAIYQAILD